jgi:peptide-methionine (S)-S-oxide reductase
MLIIVALLGVGILLQEVFVRATPGQESKVMTGKTDGSKVELATFAAGCFWGVEQAFREVPGVTATAVGYMGGDFPNPIYEEVCSGKTGHSEVVQVSFDPTKVRYEGLLEVFWNIHDPTHQEKIQYRSAIFYHTIATAVVPAGQFWRAEEYHQRYLERRGGVC